jgi:hypothetical protein
MRKSIFRKSEQRPRTYADDALCPRTIRPRIRMPLFEATGVTNRTLRDDTIILILGLGLLEGVV